MKAGWMVFWSSIIVVAVAFGSARLLVPDVVPISYGEEAQASWAVIITFALRAIVTAWVAAISFTLMVAMGAAAAAARASAQRLDDALVSIPFDRQVEQPAKRPTADPDRLGWIEP